MRSQKVREVNLNGVTPSNIFSKNSLETTAHQIGAEHIWGDLSPRDHLGGSSNTYAKRKSPDDAP